MPTLSITSIAGHTCQLLEPAQPSEHGYAVLYLHGTDEGALDTKPNLLRQCGRHGLRLMAPRTGRSWWVDRISPDFDPVLTGERYVLDHLLPWLEEHWHVRPPRIALLGKSMGGQGALRLAYRYPETFPIVAALAPAIDFHRKWEEGDEVLRAMYPTAEAARQDTALLHIHPLNWPRHQFFACDPTDDRWWESADRLHMKLASMGIPHEYDLETEAGGHGPAYTEAMAPRAVQFLVAALERERLRLPLA